MSELFFHLLLGISGDPAHIVKAFDDGGGHLLLVDNALIDDVDLLLHRPDLILKSADTFGDLGCRIVRLAN